MKIYIDGNYYNKEQAKISVYDHGLLYGDGVFEGIRIYNGIIFRLKEHLIRLYQSARAIYLPIPLSQSELQTAVEECVKLNQKSNGYIRLVVTRGVGDLGLNPFNCKKPTIIIIVDDISLYPEEYYTRGISMITSSLRRVPSDCLDPRIKSLNYLNNIMAKIEALEAGCLEAIILNRQGYVAECTGDNIFIVKQGIINTPPPITGALPGITRQTVIDAAQKMGYRVKTKTLACFDLYTADECFLTGTAAEIMPVVKIDGRPIGNGKPGKHTMVLRKKFIGQFLN